MATSLRPPSSRHRQGRGLFPSAGTVGRALGLALLLGLPSTAVGQAPGTGSGGDVPARVHAGGALLVGQPLGEFRDYVRAGFGLDGFVSLSLDAEGWVRLRLEGAALLYGRETERVCLSTTVGCRIQVDVTTSNAVLAFGVGPELAIPLGRGLAGPHLYAGLGLGASWFVTDSEVRGTSLQESPFATTRNFSDGGFAWTGSGGLRLPLARGANPVDLEFGVRHLGNGRRAYLTEGDISEAPDGSLILNVRRSDADLLLWRIGVSVGVGTP